MKSCIIFGAGIAGLSAAHVLAKAGIQVTVVEKLDTPGGLARSARNSEDKGVPSEYSWRGLGPWYGNVFTVLKQIPGAYSKLSRGIYFDLCADGPALVPNVGRFRFASRLDELCWYFEMAKVFVADRRSSEQYSKRLAKTELSKTLSAKAADTIGAVLGPWVGSDETRCSMHHVGKFFQRNIYPEQSWTNQDADGQWVQGGRSGWQVFTGPINEVWFDPWVAHLKSLGVQFVWKTALVDISRSSTKVDRVTVVSVVDGSKREMTADAYICAINPYAAAQFAQDDAFATNTRPHVQISFQVVFSDKKIQLPPPRTAIILVDSPFDITFYAQDQLWASTASLGDGVKSLWSGTCTIDSKPGLLFDKPMLKLTKEELLLEIAAQLKRSQMLANVIAKYNDGATLDDYKFRVQVWNVWEFQDESIRSKEPKWVNSVAVPPADQPTVKTDMTNFCMAGAHVQTSADLYSMEAAAESGIDAAEVLFPSLVSKPMRQRVPVWLSALQAVDNVCYACGLPNVLYVVLLLAIVAAAIAALY